MSSRDLVVHGHARVAGVDDAFDDFVPRRVELDHVDLGPRRHDVRHDGVAQLDDALDHFAGFFLQQAFAMAFADDRANFLFDRFFIGLLRRAAGDAVQQRIDDRARSTPAAAPDGPAMFHSGQVRYRNCAAAIRAIDHGSQTVATATI